MYVSIAVCFFAFVIHGALTQVVGSASGFASGVTGGGSATPVTPADITELVSYLTDDEPRVILLDKTYDFIGSEGTTTAQGCRPTSNTCPGNGGQDAINGGDDWCGDAPAVTVTYDNAAITPIDIQGDKSIVGVGDAGVMKGKGIRLINGISNVIVQNVRFTDLNPQYIWGGDAITLDGTDMIWLDHNKFDLIGRQMLVTGYDQAGKVTISNNEFDGVTNWSATCNGEHYWTMLFYGAADKITLHGNYIHDTSGRSPKVGGSGTITMQAVNNYWSTNKGHAFDIGTGATVLIEGNVFDDVAEPITPQTADAGGAVFNVPDSSAASTCSSYLGRACIMNSLSASGDFGSYIDTSVLTALAGSVIDAAPAGGVAASVVANAGVGKLSTSSSSSNATISASAPAGTGSTTASASFSSNATISASAPAGTGFTTASASSSVNNNAAVSSVAKYGQCGGLGYQGSKTCVAGAACKVYNAYYSQCE